MSSMTTKNYELRLPSATFWIICSCEDKQSNFCEKYQNLVAGRMIKSFLTDRVAFSVIHTVTLTLTLHLHPYPHPPPWPLPLPLPSPLVLPLPSFYQRRQFGATSTLIDVIWGERKGGGEGGIIAVLTKNKLIIRLYNISNWPLVWSHFTNNWPLYAASV